MDCNIDMVVCLPWHMSCQKSEHMLVPHQQFCPAGSELLEGGVLYPLCLEVTIFIPRSADGFRNAGCFLLHT